MRQKFNINQFSPCEEAIEYYSQFNSFKKAWLDCERGDWMLWIAKKLNVDKRKLTLAKGKCAELVKHLMTDERSVKAVEISIMYGHGRATEQELNIATDAADAAYAAADAAYAAAYAAYATYAAYAAADAADAAYAAAYAADADAARKRILKKCSDTCREILTNEVEKICL